MSLIQDIEGINKKEIQSAGPRYTPGVHSDAPNLQIAPLAEAIAGLLLGKQFKEKVTILTDVLKEAWKRSEYLCRDKFKTLVASPNEIILLLEQLAQITPGHNVDIVSKLLEAIKISQNICDQIAESLYDHERELQKQHRDKADSASQKKNDEREKLRSRITDINAITSALADARAFIESAACEFIANNKALLLGVYRLLINMSTQ